MKSHTLQTVLLSAPLLAASYSSADIINEWQFDHDENGVELTGAQTVDNTVGYWTNTKLGYDIQKGQLTGTNDANPATGDTRFNSGYFANGEIGSMVTTDTYLRVDFSYDFSAAANDVGNIAAFALRDQNNKDWGLRINYNQSNSTIVLQAGVNGVWQDLSPVVGLTGSISVISACDYTNGKMNYYIDTTGAGTFSPTPTAEITTTDLAGATLSKYRMQLTGDLLPTSVPAVAVENFRHASTLAEAKAGIPYLHRLSPKERQKMEDDLEIVIDNNTSEKIALYAKAVTAEPWREDADNRIESHRKADLNITLVDTYGRPVENATIQSTLVNHRFIFGGILRAKDRVGETPGIDAAQYQSNALKMFNAFGLNNALKPRLQTNLKPYLNDFFQWAANNQVPVRGHALIWPGGTHISDAVREKLDDCYNAAPEDLEAAKAALDTAAKAEIADWASQWDVYEWDVLNEPITNHDIQDMLGEDVMSEWFETAATHRVNQNTRLLLNDYQIISAPSTVGGWTDNLYPDRSAAYKANVQLMLDDSAPIHGLGFQSRFGWERTDPSLLYTRLEEFAAYGLPMAATEFEVKPKAYNPNLDHEFAPTEDLRAQITAEVLRTYFSHPLVYAFNAWTFYNDDHGLIHNDGTFKLNGLVWYYLTKVQWHSEDTLTTDSSGLTSYRGFLGDYSFVIQHGGHEYPITEPLEETDSITFIIAVDSDGDGLLDDEDSDDDNDGHADVDDLHPTDPNRWNDIPVWDPTDTFSTPDADEGVAYSKWVKWRVLDERPDDLIFTKVSGPAWLSVSDNGQLTGTPSDQDAGSNTFVISTSDGVHPPVNATVTIEVIAAPPVWSDLLFDNFENGFGTFTSSGGDGSIYTGATYAHQGNNAALIRDDSPHANIEQAGTIDATQYDQLDIYFWYYAKGMEDATDDFMLQYWNGSTWVTAQTWAYLVDFQNDEFNEVTVTLDPAALNLTSDFKIRFVCDATNNTDKVYLDEVKISGLQ
ncbi:endo-1,4-beta-xylanase [Oceaniferula spumae]